MQESRLRILVNLIRQKLITILETIIVPIFLVSSLYMLVLTLFKSIAWFQLAATIHDQSAHITAENEIMQTVGQIFGGAFVLVGIYFSAKSIFVSREGQMADRFTKALEYLGDENNLFKRIGGIHALERLSRDSVQDYWDVIEIFTSYIRNQPVDEQPQADIQAIINAFKRRGRMFRMGENQKLNLRKANLQGLDLSGIHLEGAILIEANLSYANLSGANLSNADFSKSKLVETNLNQTELDGTNFKQANLEEARLRKSKAKTAIFVEANLQKAELDSCELTGTSFTNAILIEASFDNGTLDKCLFSNTKFQNTSIQGTKITNSSTLTDEQLKACEKDDNTKITR